MEDIEFYILVKLPEKMADYVEEAVEFTGIGFSMGIIGGSAFHMLKSLYKYPTEIATACHAVRLNAPRVGGNFAAWCSVYGAVQYAILSARHKTDPWTYIFPPAISSGLLSLRRLSVRASAGVGIFVGLLRAAPEVGHIVVDKSLADRKLQKTVLRKAGEGCNLPYGRNVIGQSHMCTNGGRCMPTVYRATYSHSIKPVTSKDYLEKRGLLSPSLPNIKRPTLQTHLQHQLQLQFHPQITSAGICLPHFSLLTTSPCTNTTSKDTQSTSSKQTISGNTSSCKRLGLLPEYSTSCQHLD
ncbi:hypothetical protein PIB30_025830 [Stylosanthes scabra]|uniref:Uncharacterized protein n=1 Tax=Stylosanthes scabra TaxID=79078 RepID=A0ABU6V9B8_9FABA|nr:hypothetical protein [Stylosanthes scabra]